MRVAVNTLFLIPGEVGGSETYLRETLLAIAREHASIELILVANRENDTLLRDLFGGFAQCSFRLLPVRATNRYARIIAEQTRLPWLLRKLKPDVLWSPGYTMPFWAPCSQVVSILDMQYRSHPDDLTWLARWTTHALVMMASRRADRILTISEFSKREIVEHTRCPADRITVTPLGVEPGFASTKNEKRKTGNEMSATCNPQPYILSVANSYPHKNLHRLVEAFGLLVDKISHRLVLVGRPRLGEPQLAGAIERVPKERIQRISGLPVEALIALYQSADLFVFPSLYEGFGLPALEAMMVGVPVVTTRGGSIPEVCGDFAIYAEGTSVDDIASKVEEVLSWTAEQRAGHVERAREHAMRFKWSATAQTTVNEFGFITSSSGR